MPRYDDSPRGHSPFDRRDRRLKSPLMDRRRRDSPPSGRMGRDHMMYHHDDYQSRQPTHRAADTYNGYKILCVSNISNKYPDSTVRNELVKEFTRFGDPSIKLVYDKNTRLAYIYFNNYEDAREARHAKSRLVLLDRPALVEPIYEGKINLSRKRSLTPEYSRTSLRPISPPMQRRTQLPSQNQRSMNHDRYQLSHSRDSYRDIHGHQLSSRGNDYPSNHSSNMRNQHHQQQNQLNLREGFKKEKFPNYLHHIPPEEDDKSTRTLFVGNLEVTITEPDLRRIFERYGVVEDVDVKRPPPGQGNAYAFIKFLNLDMAHRAKVEMSGQYIGKFQCKIGYGKATPTTRIWVGGLGPWASYAQLDKEFDRFGAIRKIDYEKGDSHAYIQYDTTDAAQAACAAMRGYPLGGADKRLRIDYADPNLGHGSPRSGNDGNSFNYSSPRSNNNGSNFEQCWTSGQGDNGSSPKRRRNGSSDGDASKPSPSNGQPSLGSRDSNRESLGVSSPHSGLANGKSDLKFAINENVTSIPELIKCCPPTWSGGLILKSSCFATRLYYCSGDIQLVDLMKGPSPEQSLLRITQRLRLEEPKLEDVTRRISNAGPSGHCIMIASQTNLTLDLTNASNNAASSGGGEDSVSAANLQQRPIRNLVTYLKSKDAAGVVVVTSKTGSVYSGDQGDQGKGILYLFPPHAYSVEMIQKVAPNITSDSVAREDYLVVVLVRGAN